MALLFMDGFEQQPSQDALLQQLVEILDKVHAGELRLIGVTTEFLPPETQSVHSLGGAIHYFPVSSPEMKVTFSVMKS